MKRAVLRSTGLAFVLLFASAAGTSFAYTLAGQQAAGQPATQKDSPPPEPELPRRQPEEQASETREQVAAVTTDPESGSTPETPVKAPVTGSTQTGILLWVGLGVAVLALLVGAASVWIAGGLRKMLGSPRKLYGHFPDDTPAAQPQTLTEIVLALAEQVQALRKEVDSLKHLQPAISGNSPTSRTRAESDLFRLDEPQDKPLRSRPEERRVIRDYEEPHYDGDRPEPRIVTPVSSYRDRNEPIGRQMPRTMSGLESVMIDYRAVLQARGPEALNDFIRQHAPGILTVQADAIVAGESGDPDYLWVVSKPEWGDSSLLLPGSDAVRSWATTFQPSSGRAARNLFGRAYEVEPDNVLQVDEPAIVQRRGNEYVVINRGRLRGA